MEQDKKYNEFLKEIKGDKLSEDPDHTLSAREFYAKFWKTSLSGCILDYDGAVGNYRGETIISFNTMAGCLIRLLPIYFDRGLDLPKVGNERLDIIRKIDDGEFPSFEDDNLIKRLKCNFDKLYLRYHSLANFMPLVRGDVHINLVKGRVPYHDFPDVFFSDLKKCEPKRVFYNKVNAKYFERFGNWKAFNEQNALQSSFGGWKEFVELNYLQDFFKDEDNGKSSCNYENPIALAPKSEKMPYRDRKKFDDAIRKVCIEEIDAFLENALAIIENRAKRLAIVESEINANIDENNNTR